LLKSVFFNGPIKNIGLQAFRDSLVREVDIPNSKVIIHDSFPVGTKINKIHLSYERMAAIRPISFSFLTERRKSYLVEVSEDLNEWEELEKFKVNGNLIQFTDTRQPIIPFKQNFYRVKSLR
tara:strand:- start:282 stop:647 length:366 start_codon:yes stop_codon:yes gene_type:complete